jgi:hypothetical protein
MTKITYRVLPRKDSSACDVQIAEPERQPRIVNTFNSEAEAWEWSTEQEQIADICARLEKSRQDKR